MSPPTPNQARILWTGLTVLAITLIVACVAALIWALGRVLHLFGPVLWPLAIAAVLAYLLDPLVDLLERRKFKRKQAIVFVFTAAVLVVLGIGAAIMPRLVFETRDLASKIPDYARQIQQRSADWIEASGRRLSLLTLPKENAATNNTVASPPDAALTPAPANVQPEIPWERKLARAAVSWL